MPYPSAEERFDVVAKGIKTIRDLSLEMKDAGVLQPGDSKPMSELLISMTNVLNILDPDRATEYINTIVEDVLSKQAPEKPRPTGQYL